MSLVFRHFICNRLGVVGISGPGLGLGQRSNPDFSTLVRLNRRSWRSSNTFPDEMETFSKRGSSEFKRKRFKRSEKLLMRKIWRVEAAALPIILQCRITAAAGNLLVSWSTLYLHPEAPRCCCTCHSSHRRSFSPRGHLRGHFTELCQESEARGKMKEWGQELASSIPFPPICGASS